MMFILQKKIFLLIGLLISSIATINAQQSVARQWNEVQLAAIRIDLARPPVQARNLFHVSMAMYDAWAAYDNTVQTYLLGKKIGDTDYPFSGIPAPADKEAARNMAVSYAAYRVLYNKYATSPNAGISITSFNNLMTTLGYDTGFTDQDYTTGNPAALGNYIGAMVIAMGTADGARQAQNYAAASYAPINTRLTIANSGNPVMEDPNRWQPLYIAVSIDQSGNPVNSLQKFIGPEWGKVRPFALDTLSAAHYTRNSFDYPVYDDPGAPPQLSLTDATDASSLYFKWGHQMTAAWSSHLDPNDTTTLDISPKTLGNIAAYPTTMAEMIAFYNNANGGENGSRGYDTNPSTGLPYTEQRVRRGEYTRVASQYWADGPNSETPPGHWFTLLNTVSDHPSTTRKLENIGTALSNLEWDVKTYFILSGGMHDAAIAAWGIKGWYDASRPVSAIRYMAGLGQSSSSLLPSYHPGGMLLNPGLVELINDGDPLAGASNENVGKIKIKAWRGFGTTANPTIPNPATDAAGVDWILAADWMPYQRKTFVTPPFGGFLSGHSTYSRAGAEMMTLITGNPYFPDGLGEYVVPAGSPFLGFERGPSTDIRLQWATYRDASDQASLSRIWGGIHPPFDDMPGRAIGARIGIATFNKAKTYFRSSPLPVTLLAFTAKVVKKQEVALYWVTGTELNNKVFWVERSSDGISFEKINETAGAGTSTVSHYYTYTDANAPKGLVYYRLRQIDFDGTETFSKIVTVLVKDALTALSITPNPVQSYAYLNVYAETAQDVTITITNQIGQQFAQNTQHLQQGISTLPLDINGLPAGIYYVKLLNADNSYIVQSFVRL